MIIYFALTALSFHSVFFTIALNHDPLFTATYSNNTSKKSLLHMINLR